MTNKKNIKTKSCKMIIQVSRKTARKIKSLKNYEKESYDDILNRIIKK